MLVAGVLGDLCPTRHLLRICALPASIYVSSEASMLKKQKLASCRKRWGSEANDGTQVSWPPSIHNFVRGSFQTNAVHIPSFPKCVNILPSSLYPHFLQGFRRGPKHVGFLWFPMASYRHWVEAGCDTLFSVPLKSIKMFLHQIRLGSPSRNPQER
jgi:hypothetical protein